MRSGSVGAEQETKHDGDQFGRLVKASEVHDLSSEEKLFGKSHWLGGKDDVVASSSTTEARQTSATPPKEQAEVAAVAEMGMKGSGSESAVITPAAPQPVEEDSGDLKCGVVAEEFRFREHDVDVGEPQDTALHCVMAEEPKVCFGIPNAKVSC
ncbi:unnamed protein product [Toxocara canis]|uniref:Uncharacterized protein n=1 Tax=Toxocara canis TaxID=6265 RepID=A0A183U7R2_TOXCA|nr:unnamed protein product [Toxocara canis]